MKHRNKINQEFNLKSEVTQCFINCLGHVDMVTFSPIYFDVTVSDAGDQEHFSSKGVGMYTISAEAGFRTTVVPAFFPSKGLQTASKF